MSKTKRQLEATRYSFDYLNYLLQQEEVIERMVDRKLEQMQPQIRQMVSDTVEERIDQLINKH